jgi:hypothetical protein
MKVTTHFHLTSMSNYALIVTLTPRKTLLVLSCSTTVIFRRVRKIANSNCLLHYVCPSVCPSAMSNSAPTTRIFMEFYIWVFFENLSRKSVSFKYDENSGYFTWSPIHTVVIQRSIIIRMRNVSDKICTESKKTHFIFSNFFRKSCRFWDKVKKTQMNIWRMRIACWIPKATNVLSEHVA